MNKQIIGFLMTGAVLILLVILCILGMQQRSMDINPQSELRYEFGSAEEKYIKENPEISIYVDKELQYLLESNNESSYLEYYMEQVLQPLGMSAELITDERIKSEADCRLEIVTPNVRNKIGDDQYTTPLFQLDGVMFARSGMLKSGYVMDDRLSQDKLHKITYDGHKLSFEKMSSTEDLVTKAAKLDGDFVIGDKSSVYFNLMEYDDTHGTDLSKTYVLQEKELYSVNVCIMTDIRDMVLREILNQALHQVDRHDVSYRASQKYLYGDGPIYMKDRYDNVYLPLLVILTAVLIAFSVYYLTNRNMYDELSDRMNKLRASKRELNTTFNSVRYYMAELDLEGSVIDINRAFEDYTKGHALRRKIWDVIDIGDTDREQLRERVIDAVRGVNGKNMEFKAGRRMLAIDIFPIESVRGKAEKLLFIAMDVTDERMAKQQMLQDNKMIAVGQLAAGVAHEIRNPLGIIRNYCYVLKNMDDEEIKKQAIEQIEKSVEASGSIINNLLNFSRMTSGEVEHINVEKHILSLLELHSSAMRKRKIDLDVICKEEIDTDIVLESLDMVLINLINNAVDAMSEQGHLTVTVQKGGINGADAEGLFRIGIRDTGTGISSEIMEDIFNPFFTTKGNAGTGLGLYIVYNEVEKMDGEIQVESIPGEGTEFIIELPLIRDSCKEG